MRAFSSLSPNSRILGRLAQILKLACLLIAFGMLVHATILFAFLLAALIPHSLARPIWIAGIMLFAHAAIVIVHEAGHFLGAEIGGMCVYKANVGPIQLLRDATAWRMRSVLPRGGAKAVFTTMFGGMVYACPAPDRGSARQYLWMLAGGPAANLFSAAGFLLIAQAIPDTDHRQLVQAFAYLHLAAGVMNLVPLAIPNESDGAQILKWIGGFDQNTPGMVLNRLAGMAMHGLPDAQQLRSEFGKLAAMPEPMPLVHLFFEMKELQFSGAWHAVMDLSDALDEHLMKMGPTQAAHLTELVAMFRCEIEFSRAIATGTTNGRLDAHIDADVAWSMPCLRPRCLALEAALHGATEEAARLLEVARELSARSLDHSLRSSEDLLRRVIFEKFIRPH